MNAHPVDLTHTFEAAHRLPQLPGKCGSVHGHSWRAVVTLEFPRLDDDGVSVEFSAYKRQWREWIDRELDHGLMLGVRDPLSEVIGLHAPECKLFVFGEGNPAGDEKLATDLPWPTVEAIAVLLGRVAAACLDAVPHAVPGRVAEVAVRETATNAARWVNPDPTLRASLPRIGGGS